MNPNNSVNIEIKGAGGGEGGVSSKKNPVPPSPAASKKVHIKKNMFDDQICSPIMLSNGHPDFAADARCNTSVSFCSKASWRPRPLQTLPEEFRRGPGISIFYTLFSSWWNLTRSVYFCCSQNNIGHEVTWGGKIGPDNILNHFEASNLISVAIWFYSDLSFNISVSKSTLIKLGEKNNLLGRKKLESFSLMDPC